MPESPIYFSTAWRGRQGREGRMISLDELATVAKAIVDARSAKLAARQPWKPVYTPASQIGRECLRALVYLRVRPDLAEAVTPELASIFAEGELHQADVTAQLAKLGFRVIEGEASFRDERIELSARIDGKVEIPTGNGRPAHVPIEIKSISGKAPKSVEEIRAWGSEHVRRYYAQMTAYLLLTAEPVGLMIYKDKMTGIWTLVPVELDYDYGEVLLHRAEQVRDAVRAYRAAGTDEDREAALPTRLVSRSECARCPYRVPCAPAQHGSDGLALVDDRDFAAKLGRRADLKTSRDDYERIDDEIKERLRYTGGEKFAVAGRWLIEKRMSKNGAMRIDIEDLGTRE